MTLQDLIKIAVSVQDTQGAAAADLQDGSQLLCQIRFTNGNSRGRRVGSRYSAQFFHKPAAAEFSHRVSRETAAELVKGA